VFVPALAAWSLVLIVLVGVALYETVRLEDTARDANTGARFPQES
jgi:hypothetical protein